MRKIERIHRKMDKPALILMQCAAVVIFCLIMAIPSCWNGREEPREQEIIDSDLPVEMPESSCDSVLHIQNRKLAASSDVNKKTDGYE